MTLGMLPFSVFIEHGELLNDPASGILFLSPWSIKCKQHIGYPQKKIVIVTGAIDMFSSAMTVCPES